MTSSDAPALNPEDFERLRSRVREHCGVLLLEEILPAAQRRLRPRLLAQGFSEFGAYLAQLKTSPSELEWVVEALTPRETYFFRDAAQLQALSGEVLPRLLEGAAALRIWSAGCSTGEEAYTLAMRVEEDPRGSNVQLSVLGTDLSRDAIAAAERGLYGLSALRDTSPEARLRHFEEAEGGRVRVRPALRERVRFFPLNFLDADAAAQVPPCDLIVCRNVMVHMQPAARERLFTLFADRLRDGGYLLLGHAESLSPAPECLDPVELGGVRFHRRAARPSASAGKA